MPWLRRKPLYAPPAPMESEHNMVRTMLSEAFIAGLAHELTPGGDALILRLKKADYATELDAEVRISALVSQPGRLDLRVQKLNVRTRVG